VSVPRTASLEQVHAWSDAIEQRVAEIVPADVVVHAEPQAPPAENVLESIRATAQRMGHAIHDLSVHQQGETLYVELHLEVNEELTLREAHAQATALEDAILALPEHPAEVNIHIEPMGSNIARTSSAAGEMKDLAGAIEKFVNSLAAEYDELVNCHHVRVRQVEHRILASCHCLMKDQLAVTKVHDVTAALEDRVKEKFPQIFRVTIHPEPDLER
jgi:divalent metal cation (Fe/Co/Zn/Cd) transporter